MNHLPNIKEQHPFPLSNEPRYISQGPGENVLFIKNKILQIDMNAYETNPEFLWAKFLSGNC